MPTTIKAHQIVILQTLLSKKFKDRDDRLHFVSSFIGRELPSTKNLTEDEFFTLAEHLGYKFEQHAYFNPDNSQHRYLLSTLLELGWRNKAKPHHADLKRLGRWFCSSKNPYARRLHDCTPYEVGKINKIFEKMLSQHYEKKEKRR